MFFFFLRKNTRFFVFILFDIVSSNLPVDAVDASGSVSTGVAVTLVDVDLAVGAGRSRTADALVTIDAILASTPELARIALALVDLRLAQFPSETRETVAREAILSVDASSGMAGIGSAVVDIRFARRPCKTGRTFAGVAGDPVLTSSAVLARRGCAVVDVDLTMGTGEAVGARTLERIDQIAANPAVQTRR